MTTVTEQSASHMPLAELMRTGSRQEHEDAEEAGFMRSLLAGGISTDGYVAYLSQLRHIYAALEEMADELAGDPIADLVLHPALRRLPSLNADLKHWGTTDPLPANAATAEYAARIRSQSRVWSGYFVAHHYTRYLGDLSGGQAIGRIMTRTYGLTDGSGVAFYAFPDIPKVKPFKDEYRAALNSLQLTRDAQNRILDEVKIAFRLNTAVFDSLGAFAG